MNKCVIASDSFKGTLSSKQIANLFEKEFKKAFPKAHLEKVVRGDGGENTLEVFANALQTTDFEHYRRPVIHNRYPTYANAIFQSHR